MSNIRLRIRAKIKAGQQKTVNGVQATRIQKKEHGLDKTTQAGLSTGKPVCLDSAPHSK